MMEELFETGFSRAIDDDDFLFVGNGGAATGVKMSDKSSPAEVMIGTIEGFDEEDEREGS